MSNKEIKFRFGWGNPHFLLDILQDKMPFLEYRPNLSDMIYGPYEGTPELIKATHQVIEQTTGQVYNHILITNGASSAINLLLRRFKTNGGSVVHTTPYGYPSYEDMIKRAGLTRVRQLNPHPQLAVGPSGLRLNLIDSPENPTGKQHTIGDKNEDIWDGVYHNTIYTLKTKLQPSHKYFVGSYSKLLGLAGCRIGFIATNDPLAYEALLAESRNELTGISRPSQEMITNILSHLDLFDFMGRGNIDLGYNKEEFQKIEYIFDSQPVNSNGMFYCVKAHDSAINLLDKVGVEYVRLDEETIRLSMGQTKLVTKSGISAILKEDKR